MIDVNEFDTQYATCSQERRSLIENFDQMWAWYVEIGIGFPERAFESFSNENRGLIVCSE